MRVALGCLLALAGCASVRGPDDRLRTFEAHLAVQDSATVALGQWCAERGLAPRPAIRAIRVDSAAPQPSAQIRAMLGVGDAEPLAYRHVRLACGSVVLSEAHNWYVPARLTPAMNAQLASTDTPFGTVVAPLGFRRERGAALHGAATGCPADTVLSHSAVLRIPGGGAISALVECYTPANIAE